MNRCICGLAVRHHYYKGRRIDCWQAAARHQRATSKRMGFAALLRRCLAPKMTLVKR